MSYRKIDGDIYDEKFSKFSSLEIRNFPTDFSVRIHYIGYFSKLLVLVLRTCSSRFIKLQEINYL